MRERLDDLLIAKHLLDESRLFALGLRALAEHTVGSGRDEFCDEYRDGSEQNDNRGNYGVDHHHEYKRTENSQNAREYLRESEQKSLGKTLGIVDNSVHCITAGMRINVGKRKHLDVREGIVPDIPCHVICDAIVDSAHQPLREGGNADKYRRLDKKRTDSVKVDLPRADYHIDSVTDKYRHVERQRHRDQGKEHRNR